MTNQPQAPHIDNGVGPHPELSVVIVVVGGEDHLTRCLLALSQQIDPPEFEIIVPVDDGFGDVTIPSSLESRVTILRCGGKRTFAELRARGARRARSPLLALTEDHCLPRPGWCAAVVEQHRQPHAAIGGPVDKTGSDSAVNWSVYLHDYGRYMSPLPAGPTDYLTDCNVTYKRRILDQYAELWRTEFHETTVNWSLANDGHTLWLAPELSVGQRRIFTFAHAVWDRYAFGRLFASTRVAATSFGRRAYYAVFTPALPVILVARAGQIVLNKRRAIGQFLRSLPMLTLLTSIWSIGELTGYLTSTAPRALSPKPLDDGSSSNPPKTH